jgi:hypothetical protein
MVLTNTDRYLHERYAGLRVAVLVATVAFGLIPGARRVPWGGSTAHCTTTTATA